MRNLRPIWTGLLLLGGTTVLCAKEHQFSIQNTVDFPGKDTIVGRVWFNVEREREGHVYFKPLMTPTLGMGRLKGSDNPGLGLVQCVIVKRVAIVSPDVVLNVTKAICGSREYVVDEVLFDLSKESAK
jgi:hypothetical protein